MTFDITRNTKYRSSGRPDSPDIDHLRVEVRYHSEHILQFKVCVVVYGHHVYVRACFIFGFLQLGTQVEYKPNHILAPCTHRSLYVLNYVTDKRTTPEL